MTTLEIYTTKTCPFCVAAKRLLDKKGVTYTEIDVGAAPEIRQAMTKRAGGRTSVPQVFVGDIHIGGCDDLHAAEDNGTLEKLLAA
ncbi:glutaredoxin 3 [Thioclava sp. SK-1]|uniref:glutaredoxin 3 n=1 Tax=Thioclava sp. SK-1 TaxID=1889770 RepID=UPI00082582DE|nr:glutaredoxin 3 [Thioclava sp. SK-1]OCX63418.1 glutaredoxin 3 [Thioclava sp. SK-1]